MRQLSASDVPFLFHVRAPWLRKHLAPQQALRFRQWDKRKNAMGPIQIYDLSADICEASNLAKEHPELVEKARKYFAEMRTDNPEFPLELHRKAKRKGKSGKKGKNARK